MRFLILATAACALAAPAWAWPGRPAGSPPAAAQPGGPPPAWAETAKTARWLAYSSYCWHTTCADYLPPTDRTDLPKLVVPPGTTMRIHFAVVPASVSVRVYPSRRVTPLRAAKITTWRPAAAGVAVVEIKAARGSASYAVRIRRP